MISLKRYLDKPIEEVGAARAKGDSPCAAVIEAYISSLMQMSESGGFACPAREGELKKGMVRIVDTLRDGASPDSVAASQIAVRGLLQGWGKEVATHYEEKATDVRDLLLVIARTAESLGNKDDRIARSIDSVTSQLASITNLNDVSRMRAAVEASARDLKGQLEKITAEGKALIDHLRAEVSTYQTKLEKAERVSSRDALTGVGSRLWVEARIQERIDTGTRFSVVLIDIDGFHKVVECNGNLVGDLLLKEFSRELRSACRFTDVVGRWGNDEFMLLLDEVGEEVRAKIERLRTAISKKYHVPGRTGYVNLLLSASIGVAEGGEDDDVQTVLERADRDMCRERSEALHRTA